MLARALEALNGRRGDPHSFDALEALLGDQAYRLSFWGVAAEEINYRRFFDINDLAAIRIEEPSVLELVHAKPFELLRSGKVTGLRIDHVDGLFDPARYLGDLRRTGDLPPFYLVVEKILTGDEELPADWPVQGTTGYDFLNQVNALFVDPDGLRALTRGYERATGPRPGGFAALVHRTKRLILDGSLPSELYILARRLDRISEQHRWSRDFTLNSLHGALREVIAGFPVYRSYVQPGTVEVNAADSRYIQAAIRDAKRRNQTMSASLFDFIADILLLRDPEGISDADRVERRELTLRLQQLTGPVMAKGLEDTAFYRYFPLSSLNEVGGHPNPVAGDVDGFGRWCVARAARWPHSMSASATHDTKRGEDVRARLAALSEMPHRWSLTFRRWRRLNRPHRRLVDEALVPDANEEYLLYQTLLGAWPTTPPDSGGAEPGLGDFVDRVSAYMNKAIKEAKQHTSWMNINHGYERAIDEFVRAVLDRERSQRFIEELEALQRPLARAGALTSLSQLLLKITAPGVPDFYQGTELESLSLVDPDNRRPVDYGKRRALLDEIKRREEEDRGGFIRAALASPGDGALKMFVMRAALRFRRARRALFDAGDYLPLPAEGSRRRHVIAFARRAPRMPDAPIDNDALGAAVVITGRLYTILTRPDSDDVAAPPPVGAPAWHDTFVTLPPELPRGGYREVLSGRRVDVDPQGRLALSEACADLPLALLEPLA